MCMNKEKMERSTSPVPQVSRALFRDITIQQPAADRSKRPSLEDDYRKYSSNSSVSSCSSVISVRQSNRRKSSTVFEEGELKRSKKYLDLTSEANSENIPPKRNQLIVPGNRPRPRGLSQRDTNIFRFSEVGSPRESLCQSPLLGTPSPLGSQKSSCRTPFTGARVSFCRSPLPGVPRISVCQDNDDVFLSPYEQPPSSRLLLTPSTTYSPRPSSCTSLHLDYSPNIALGIQCNTPCRLKLEMEGLGHEKLVLGRGAYGTVVLGQWRGQKVAVKVMEKEQGGKSARRRKSLESELQALKLDHDNIVKVHGVFAAEDRYAVIIMEYVGSRNLHRLLIETPDKYLGRSWLLGVGRQISSALAHCHSRGVVHMDIKPANVLVTSSGACKLGDFGCSVGMDSGDVPLDHSLVGTPGYQAPEFLRGGLPHPACDVYSLGILLWQLDSREVPFQGQHPQTIMFRTVSCGARPLQPTSPCIGLTGLSSLYKQCWNREPEQRPSSKLIHSRLCNLASLLPASLAAGTNSTLRI